MRKFLLILSLAFVNAITAQAHIGNTLQEIKDFHPEKTFKIDYTNSGQKYAQTDMYYGTFLYYFDKETGLSNFCMQIPDNMTALNAQVEAYNKKYVIISDKKWKAYLDGGGIISIDLEYNEKYKLYVFKYTEL